MKPEHPKPKRIHLNTADQEPAAFQHRVQRHNKRLSLCWKLAIWLFFLFWVSVLLLIPYRQFHVYPAWIFEHIRDRITQFYLFLNGDAPHFGITIDQYLAVMLVGAALATCGTVLQGSLRNTLAGPSTMGIMSGGTLGGLVYLLVFTSSASGAVYSTADLSAHANRTFWEIYSLQLCVLAGCFAAVGVVLLVSFLAGRGQLNSSAMVMSGMVLSTLVSNLTMIVQYYILLKDPNDSRIELLSDMMMGSFDRITTLRDVMLMGIPILLCIGGLMLLRGWLNLLSLGAEEATAMGLNVRFYRYLVIILCTILTAVVVAFCGRIGFLGFMIPLVGRKLAGPDMGKLLPCALLLGAILMMLVYDLAYITGLTGYLSLFTSSVGSIVMIISILRQKGGGSIAFNQRGNSQHMGC